MILVVAALKGGVGKTTTSVYLSAIAASARHAVTLIDADPQASAAEWIEASPDERLKEVEIVEAPSDRLLTRAMDRVDGRLKVTGAAKYAADYTAEHLAYGIPVVSTIANGRVLKIDSSRAEQLPGVSAVITERGEIRTPWVVWTTRPGPMCAREEISTPVTTSTTLSSTMATRSRSWPSTGTRTRRAQTPKR